MDVTDQQSLCLLSDSAPPRDSSRSGPLVKNHSTGNGLAVPLVLAYFCMTIH